MRSCFIHVMFSRVHRPPSSPSDSLLVVTGAGDFKHVGNIRENVNAQVNRKILHECLNILENSAIFNFFFHKLATTKTFLADKTQIPYLTPTPTCWKLEPPVIVLTQKSEQSFCTCRTFLK